MLTFEDHNIGVDIEDVKRFTGLLREKDKGFLEKIFTEKELDYCFAKDFPAQHLAGRFSAKEAIIKALSAYGEKNIDRRNIEIVSASNIPPKVFFLNESLKSYKAKVSISHTKEVSIAFCTATKV